MTETLKLASIRIDGDTQLRAETSQDIIQSYAQDMLEGDIFPPIVVYHDGTNYWLSDGFHRFFAVKEAGKEEILADVRQGTRRDALLHAAEANRKHGLQLTNKDKRRIVTLFLNDPEWSKWSDRELARRCGVSHPFVSSLRSSLESVTSERTYTTKHGTVTTMDVTRIGNDPYEGLSDYVVKELQERDASPEDIASIAKWAREYKSDVKGNAVRALLIGGSMWIDKTEGRYIDAPPYTQEELENIAWHVWCLAPQDLETAFTIGDLKWMIINRLEREGKDLFDIEPEDVLKELDYNVTLALADFHITVMFRACYTIWHYVSFGMSKEQKEKFLNGEKETLEAAAS